MYRSGVFFCKLKQNIYYIILFCYYDKRGGFLALVQLIPWVRFSLLSGIDRGKTWCIIDTVLTRMV